MRVSAASRRPRDGGLRRQRDSLHRGRSSAPHGRRSPSSASSQEPAPRTLSPRERDGEGAPANGYDCPRCIKPPPLPRSAPRGLTPRLRRPPRPARRAERLSHARRPRRAGPRRNLATPETIAFYRRRTPDWNGTATPIAWRHFGESGTTLTLVPSGHILGSAQVLLKPAAAASSTPATSSSPAAHRRPGRVPADVLVTESPSACPFSASAPADPRGAPRRGAAARWIAARRRSSGLRSRKIAGGSTHPRRRRNSDRSPRAAGNCFR